MSDDCDCKTLQRRLIETTIRCEELTRQRNELVFELDREKGRNTALVECADGLAREVDRLRLAIAQKK